MANMQKISIMHRTTLYMFHSIPPDAKMKRHPPLHKAATQRWPHSQDPRRCMSTLAKSTYAVAVEVARLSGMHRMTGKGICLPVAPKLGTDGWDR